MIASTLALLAPMDSAGGSRSADPAWQGPRARVLMAALYFIAVALSSSHAFQCKCNDDSWISDCRWEEWTCTEPDDLSMCYARIRLLSDGSIRRDFGCLRTDWNPPDFCSGLRNTNTDVWECCEGNLCNEHLSPRLALPTHPSTPPPSPTSTVPSGSALAATTSLAVPGPSPSPAASPEITATAAPPTEPPAAPLRCRCNGDLCHGATSCETNHKCFREVRYHKEEDYEETRLGCMDTIDQVNLDGVGVCSGKLDDANSKLRCCDQKDFCNLDLHVSLDVEEVEQPSTDSADNSPDNDKLFLILSVMVVAITMVTVVVVLVVLCVYCLRYQREKAKVVSVDHLQEKEYSSGTRSTYIIDTPIHIHSHPSRKEYSVRV